MTKKNTILRGIFSVESPDRAGEVVSIKGIDLSTISEGRGLVNSEHDSSFANTVGKVVQAKKLFSEKDCTDAFEKKMFASCNGAAMLVGTIELFDGPEDHDEARAISKIIKHYKRKGELLPLGLSVEGGILQRDGSTITRSIVKKIAITASACNEAATVELASELTKSEFAAYDRIAKSTPKDILATGTITEVYNESDIAERISGIKDRLVGLTKALEAGFATGAPSTLTQGAALQKQTFSLPKAKLKKPKEETEVTEETGLKPIDKDKAAKIDGRKEEAKLAFKLKKAEYMAYSFYNSLKK